MFSELHGLIVKTVGIVEPIRRALTREMKSIHAAFVYGSLAKGTDVASSDIDVLIVSDSLRYPEAYELLQAAEATLPRPVNPTVLTLKEWRKQSSRGDSFAARIASQPRLFVIGAEDDLR